MAFGKAQELSPLSPEEEKVVGPQRGDQPLSGEILQELSVRTYELGCRKLGGDPLLRGRDDLGESPLGEIVPELQPQPILELGPLL